MFSNTVPTIIEVYRSQTSLSFNCQRFILPSRLFPRLFVNEQVYRQITAVLHSHPDHCRGALLPNKLTVKLPPFFYYHPDHCYGILLRNKVSVKLPMFSITVSTIARTDVFPRLSTYYRRITAITIELPRSPSLYREHRRINAFTVEYRNCRRFSLISKSLPRFLVIEYVYR